MPAVAQVSLRFRTALIIAAVAATALLSARPASAREALVPAAPGAVAAGSPPSSQPTKAFALVIGVNRASDRTVTALRYADDDAVRFGELFRTVGMQTTVLATLDSNTRRLHPDAAAEARPARMAAVTQAVDRLAAEAARARRAGSRVAFYFVYAGHGRVDGDRGGGSITLEDAELRGSDILARIIDRVGADETHVIVDACNSYFLVLGRGPGGRRRPIEGFAQLGPLAERKDVGFLLSTSSARDSHEWAAFQAGVFSQEVRSGLYGAADVNGDGLVTYLEVAAFVRRANDAIRNEKYRPDLYAQAPAGARPLMDLRKALSRRIEVTPGDGHQFLEDTSGIRLADFHNAGATHLVRPSEGRLYLRRTGDDREYVLPPEVAVLRTADLALQEPRSTTRNAAHDAFTALFQMPFGTDALSAYQSGGELTVVESPRPDDRSSWLRPKTLAVIGLGALGAAATVWGVASLMEARELSGGATTTLPQTDVLGLNQQIETHNRRGGLLLGTGAAIFLGGLAVLLWPDSPMDLAISDDRVVGGVHGRF